MCFFAWVLNTSFVLNCAVDKGVSDFCLESVFYFLKTSTGALITCMVLKKHSVTFIVQ